RIAQLERQLAEANRVIEKAAAVDSERRFPEGRLGVAPAAGPGAEEDADRARDDEARARRAAQQLLEINRLKSDFIVNAGRELDASLQSVLGFAELLGQGSYGKLTPEQQEAVKNIYAWGRRMKSDIDWLVEYGSTRARRLDTANLGEQQTQNG
ncbi:MAG TPA: hypothetical protein VJX67_04005, partial [Blastocatellia bacterium]|nr:hypothetical protein [Blastocatellia bacterium]